MNDPEVSYFLVSYFLADPALCKSAITDCNCVSHLTVKVNELAFDTMSGNCDSKNFPIALWLSVFTGRQEHSY